MRHHVALASLLVASLSPLVPADRVSDDANDGRRDSSKWSERESSDARRTQARESGGRIRIESRRGRGGGAAFVSTVFADWTDPFYLEFEHRFSTSRVRGTAQSASGGLAMGFGTFDAASGYRDGVNVQVVHTSAGRSLEVEVRVAGVAVFTDSAALDAGAHEFHIAFTGGADAAMLVYLDGETTPTLAVDGIATYFAGFESQGMAIALFGGCTAKVKLDSSFDDFLFSGDRHDDSDDAGYDDSDGSSDDDEDDGYDDHGDHGGGHS
ncbi:MAG: hypothetical protein U0625_07550 [Phycisphaerales bacterium]